MMETTKAILSALATADSGEVGGLPLSDDLYPEVSLSAAIEAFAAYCEVERSNASTASPLTVSIVVRSEHRAESRLIIGSFLNFLLGHSLQNRLQLDEGD